MPTMPVAESSTILKTTLEKLSSELKSNFKRNKDLCDSYTAALNSLLVELEKAQSTTENVSSNDSTSVESKSTTTGKTSQSPDSVSNASTNTAVASPPNGEPKRVHPPKVSGDFYWEPFKAALHPKQPVKIREMALDGIYRLIAHKSLRGTIPLATTTASSETQSALSKDKDNKDSKQQSTLSLRRDSADSNISDASVNQPQYPRNATLIDEIVHHVCCSFPPLYTHIAAEESVHIQVLKVLLTAVTSNACEVHDISLLKALQTCFNIFLYSKNKNIVNTAKAALTQMVNLVITRMEKFSDALTRKKDQMKARGEMGKLEINGNQEKDGKDMNSNQVTSLNALPEEKELNVEAIVNVTENVVSNGESSSQEASSTAASPSAEVVSNATSVSSVTNESNVPDQSINDTPNENVNVSELNPSEPGNDNGLSTQQPSDTAEISSTNTAEKKESETKQNVPASVGQRKKSVADHNFIIPTQDYIRRNFDNPNDPLIGFYNEVLRKDVYLVFRALCRLSTKSFNEREPMNQQQDDASFTTRCRQLSLELLLSLLNNSGPTFKANEQFIQLIKSELCVSLSKNGVSSNAMVFELSLSIFGYLLAWFKAPLKIEIEVLFNEIYLHILEMSNASYKQKLLVLQCLAKICQDSQTLIDLYVNYDCDLSMASIFERVAGAVTRTCQGQNVTQSASQSGLGSILPGWITGNEKETESVATQEKKLKIGGLKCLHGIVTSMVDRIGLLKPVQGVTHSSNPTSSHRHTSSISSTYNQNGSEHNTSRDATFQDNPNPYVISKNPLDSISMSPNQSSPVLNETAVASQPAVSTTATIDIEASATMKALLKQGVDQFNTKPSHGIKFLVEKGLIQREVKPIANFLLTTPGLNKKKIGEYLGEGDAFNIEVMHSFVDQMDFTGMQFVQALRAFLQAFRLPGEAQKIDRLMEKFADRYCETNPDVFEAADTAYVLSFSVIMLNTDLHSKQVKNKMDKPGFIKNNRGINNNKDLPEEFLGAIFDDIAKNEIVMEEEQLNQLSKLGLSQSELDDEQKRELYKRETAQIQKKSQARIKGNRKNTAEFRTLTHPEIVRPMYAIVWGPFLAAFGQAFEECADASQDLHSNSPTTSPIHETDETDVVNMCVDGLAYCASIAMYFDLQTERDACINSLANLTNLSTIFDLRQKAASPTTSAAPNAPQPTSNIRIKNVAAMKAIVNLPHNFGDKLETSWATVLRTLSQMELLRSILQGNSSSPTESSSPPIESATSPTSVPATFVALATNMVTKTSVGLAENTRTIKGATAGIFASNRNNADLVMIGEKVLNELRAQSLVTASDKVYKATVKLSGTAVIHFFRCICQVSVEEVESGSPRLYSLEKIVEIAYYNMNRIRFEWSQIWKLLQNHFNVMGCNSNPKVATFAIDSLRQLSLKFLDKEELAHFHTQSDFMKPFEYIMKNSKSHQIRELIITSFSQMIQSRSKSIKSGWKSIFVVFSRVTMFISNEPEERSLSLSLLKNTFSILSQMFESHLEAVGPAFVEFSSCLVDFSLTDVDEVVDKSLKLLRGCVKVLMDEHVKSEVDGSTTQSSSAKTTNINSPVKSLNSPQIKVGEDQFFLKWFPIFGGFSKIIIDSSSPNCRSKALEYLFNALTASGDLFESKYWKAIHRSVIVPIFEDLGESDPRRKEGVNTTVWIQALKFLVDLYINHYRSLVSELEILEGILRVTTLFVGRKNENLSQCGVICLHQLLTHMLQQSSLSESIAVPPQVWTAITTTVDTIFRISTPVELMQLGQIKKVTTDAGARFSKDDPQVKAIDFTQITIKCASHLAAVQSVKDMVELLMTQYASVPKPLDSNKMYETLPYVTLLHTWSQVLFNSYKFALEFNDNEELRVWIAKRGFTSQTPNLMKQENLTVTTYLMLLYFIYGSFGDVSVLPIVEGSNSDGTTSAGSIPVLEPLISTSRTLIHKFMFMLTDPQKNERQISLWCPVIVLIYSQLNSILFPFLPSTLPPLADSLNVSSPDYPFGFSSTQDYKKYKLAENVPELFYLATKLLETQNMDLRNVLQDFLENVSVNILKGSWTVSI
ncbi:hypothetical protein BKA69DRAFT_732408 [Paraphysoderma sedebokerense]|nr:hypothetical protein BKA69DRAFT_732408 [Paraphysoderma sedebokerense]